MDENTMTVIMTRQVIVGALLLASIISGAVLAGNIYGDRSSAAAEASKAAAAHSEELKAMWDKMPAAKQP